VIVDQILNPPTLFYTHSEDFHPQPLKDVPYNPIHWKSDSIAMGVRKFIESVISDTEPPVKLMDAYFAVAACASAYKSLESNKMEPVITQESTGD
jgi:hypothetical protein